MSATIIATSLGERRRPLDAFLILGHHAPPTAKATKMVDDSTQMAAAILAVEASKQQLASMDSKGPRDVPGELLQLQRWFAAQLAAKSTK